MIRGRSAFHALGRPSLINNPYRKNLAAYLAGLSLDLWLRLRETSGTTPANAGTLSGLTITWTPASGALGATGPNGPNEAYTFDGAAASGSLIAVANNATLAQAVTFRGGMLLNPASLGGNSAGAIFAWNNGFANTFLRMLSTNRLTGIVKCGTSDAAIETNNNQISDLIGAWGWLFWDYSSAVSGTGRLRVWKYILSTRTLSLLTLATNTAGVGETTAQSNALQIGNESGRSRTQNGPIDEFVYDAGALWDTATLQLIGDLTPNFT